MPSEASALAKVQGAQASQPAGRIPDSTHCISVETEAIRQSGQRRKLVYASRDYSAIEGLDRLRQVVSSALSRTFRDVDIDMPIDNGKLLAYLAAKGEILSTRYGEQRVNVHCRIPQKYLGRISEPEVFISDRFKKDGEPEERRDDESDGAAAPADAVDASGDSPQSENRVEGPIPAESDSSRDVDSSDGRVDEVA